MVDGLLVDFYGTVVDDDGEVVRAICERAARLAPEPADPAAIGDAWWRAFLDAVARPPFRTQWDLGVSSLAAALASSGIEGDAAGLCSGLRAYWRRPPLRPGTAEFLAGLQVPYCIVSNIDRDDLDAAVRHHALAPAAVVTSEDVRAYKPNRVIFEAALAALGLPADRVLHVGDSWSADVLGAAGAGIRPVWVDRGHRGAPDPDVRTITELADLWASP